MAKKSNRNRSLSSAARSKSTQTEQTQSPSQHANRSPLGPKTQIISSAAAKEDSTLPRLTQTEELPPAVRCAHSIALLELLDPRPQSLASFKPDSTKQEDEGRTLSIRQERELATNLAFLAGVSNNPDYIMGVCIEELPGATRKCQVMVSINQRRPSNGQGILERVKKGFEQIFERLSRMSAKSSTQEGLDLKETVLKDIIALCHRRILGRLRSKHSGALSKDKKSNKRFTGSVLREFMEKPWQTRVTESSSLLIHVPHLDVYQSSLNHLLEDLETFEAADHYRHENLLRLVKSVARAFKSTPIKALLDSLNNNDMDHHLRKWLHSCLTKIHRYSEVASILCHRARRIPMLRNVLVTIVSDEVKLEDTPASCENIMDIWRFLARFQYKGKTVQMGMLPEWLRSQALSSMENYSQSVSNILMEAKVHAEIQLLAYYENKHFKRGRPRVLASSKKTCALCNTIITIHGGYDVPKSHGKLYKGWRLPAAHQNGALQNHLNAVLERSISTRLATLIPLSRRPRVDFDNESSIFSFTLSASTLPECSASTISDDNRAAAAVVDGDFGSEYLLNEGQVSESSHTEHATIGEARDENEDIAEENGSVRASEHTDDQANSPIPHNSMSTDGSTTSLSRQPAVAWLEHGETILVDPDRNGMVCFRSKRIEMVIDETSSRFSFELLGTAEADAVLRDETKPVADVRTISFEMDVLLPKCADGQVYISHGKEVIKICARLG